MNPKNCLYDNQASLSVNTGLGTPLLSRFDLIFKLVDASDVERDSNVTAYLLNRAIQGIGLDVRGDEQSKQPWTMEKLRAYISIVKGRFEPDMSDEAALLLERHYEKCRSAQSNTIPVTVRFLESLIRLSQAHARLMFRNVVTLEDAVAVVRVMECTAFAYGGFDCSVDDFQNVLYCDPMTTDFSSSADLDFLCFEYRILDRYGLLNYLDEDLQQTASGGCGSSWQDVENNWNTGGNGADWNAGGNVADPLSVMPGYQQPNNDPYESSGQPLFPPAPLFGPGKPGPTQTVEQDHYGRVHFSQSATQSKRQRR
jgi:hypothetical protein